MSYNLLDVKWIPVLYRNGDWEQVGIRRALEDAGRIRQVAASNPMDRAAILRFLLAVLYWCRGSPTGGENADKTAPIAPKWFTRLSAEPDYFALLGDGKRFFQQASGKDKKLTANYLVHEVPTGTNAWHFRHSTDRANGLCLACCAMGLVRLPLFTTSGGSGKSPGVNAKPPLYVIPVGASLAETLRLSWSSVPDLGVPRGKSLTSNCRRGVRCLCSWA